MKTSLAVQAMLVNAEGKKVKEVVNEKLGVGKHLLEIDVKDIPTGVYFLNLWSENQLMKRKAIVVGK